jgi:hypothetical protein
MPLHKRERKVSRKVFVLVYKEYGQLREYAYLLRDVLEDLKYEGAPEELMEGVRVDWFRALQKANAMLPLVTYHQAVLRRYSNS